MNSEPSLRQQLVDPAASDDGKQLDEPEGIVDTHNGKGASAFSTGLNMLNELEGAGILGLPYALRLLGWSSLICLGCVGSMAGFTGYLLAMCMYEPATGNRVRDSYGAVGHAAFGMAGERAVKIVLMSNLLAVGVVYLVLVGSSMEILVPLGLEVSWLPLADRRVWTAAATLVVLPGVHVGGYKKLALLSALGLLCLTAVLVLGFYAASAQIASAGSAGALTSDVTASPSSSPSSFTSSSPSPSYSYSYSYSYSSSYSSLSSSSTSSDDSLFPTLAPAFWFGMPTEPEATSATPPPPPQQQQQQQQQQREREQQERESDSMFGSVSSSSQLAPSLFGVAIWPTWDEFSLGHLPVVVSIFVFAFSAHGIFPALEAEMEEPRHFPKVVAVVFLTNISLKAAFAFTCYLAYGQQTQEVVAGNFKYWSSMVVSVLIMLNTILSFPLPLVPVWRNFGITPQDVPKVAKPEHDEERDEEREIEQEEDHQGKVEGKSCCVRAAWRTGIVIGCGLVAIAIPNFALAMGFMGSLTLSFLTFIFPSSFYLRIHGKEAGWVMRVACVFVACFGIVALVSGVYSNVLLAINGDGGGGTTHNNATNATTPAAGAR